jgi:hypothetical protein
LVVCVVLRETIAPSGEALRHLGCGEDTVVGKATHAFARLHGTVADVIEGAGRAVQEAAIRTFGRL